MFKEWIANAWSFSQNKTDWCYFVKFYTMLYYICMYSIPSVLVKVTLVNMKHTLLHIIFHGKSWFTMGFLEGHFKNAKTFFVAILFTAEHLWTFVEQDLTPCDTKETFLDFQEHHIVWYDKVLWWYHIVDFITYHIF